MTNEHIPNYQKYTSENLIDLYKRIDKEHNPQKYQALIREIKTRFNIEGEIDLTDPKLGEAIISRIKQEDPDRIKLIENKKKETRNKNLIRVYGLILALIMIYLFGIREHNSTLVVAILLALSFGNFSVLIQEYKTGKEENKNNNPDTNKPPLNQIITLILGIAFLAIAVLILTSIITI